MKRLYSFLTTITAATLLLTACKDSDTTPPVVALSSITDGQNYQRGDTLRLTIEATDDKGLGSARLDIHNAADGHNHGKTSAAWAWDSTIALNGTSQTISLAIPIPADAQVGPYHVLVYCLDIDGNEAEFSERQVNIVANTSENPPVISALTVTLAGEAPVTNPSEEIHLGIAAGQDTAWVALAASIAAPNSLAEVHLQLVHLEEDSHGKTANLIWEKEIAATGTAYSLADSVPFARASLQDNADYGLTIHAVDQNGVESLSTVVFHVSLQP